MGVCKFCRGEIDWLTLRSGKRVPVDSEPYFIIPGGGKQVFYTEDGDKITGRLAVPAEWTPGAPLAFIPHQLTCPAMRREPIRSGRSGGRGLLQVT